MNGKSADPCLLVMFGASGDLARRKLMPALYHLAVQKMLPERFAVLGVSRSPFTHEQFRALVRERMEQECGALDPAVCAWLEKRIYYCAGDASRPETYGAVNEAIAELDERHGTGGNAVFYMATSPEFFGVIAEAAAAQGLAAQDGRWRRFVVEKPFGFDLESARALNARLLAVLKEDQIYRIDHYLGKETVQNLLALRFGNGIFEPVWNRRYVDHVQISVAESLGVEGRGPYYDKTGALRDMVPNHILQLISLVAMEPPVSFGADSLRDEQVKVLRAFAPLTPDCVRERAVRGQYGAGMIGGKQVPGYREEPKVAKDSRTETFVAMRVDIENWRWNGVPFFFRTGKRLPCQASEVVIQFKRVPHVLFRDMAEHRLPPNQLVVRIQPNEGISLNFQAKVPGQTFQLAGVDMDFRYRDYFGTAPSTGYERLLHDAMIGDATLFKRADMLEEGWSYVAPVLEAWRSAPPEAFPDYPAGTWGPPRAAELLGAPWRRWRSCAGS